MCRGGGVLMSRLNGKASLSMVILVVCRVFVRTGQNAGSVRLNTSSEPYVRRLGKGIE